MNARIRRWVLVTAIGIGLVSLGWWAGQATLDPQVSVDQQPVRIIATVKMATLGRSLPLTVTVQRPTVQIAVNGLSGTVTSVDMPATVGVGDLLYSVDAVPVRAVQGNLPFYRDLGPGAKGEDVVQLQRAMTTLKYYRGQINGRFDVATQQAVRAWQRVLNLPESGTVRLGELVAVPKLPLTLRLDEHITKGSRVSVGTNAVFAATGALTFTLVVAESQGALIKPDAAITVTYQQHIWQAAIADTVPGTDNTVRFVLSAPGGGPVCADACDDLPIQERLSLGAEITLVPKITGPAVPLAAVNTNPDGSAFVVMEDGTRRDVTMRTSSGGVAIVQGVDIDERVVAFGVSTTDTER